MEKTMQNIMFSIPSDLSIRKVTITADTVNGGDPMITRTPDEPRTKKSKT
jgi:ATP-dependent protease Clp ATPase subunit